MGVNIRLPQITDPTEKGQLAQIRSYLFQLAEQLQWALKNVDTSSNTVVVTPTPKSLSAASPKGVSTLSSGTESAEAKFASIKALIIKSADIVDAYYEEINKRLVGEYVAVSDFGTFREQTIQDIEESSTGIDQFYTNIQEIIGDIENINFKLLEVNAHIRAGLLFVEDGMPVYGLEIGQKNIVDGEEVFNKYARFTADRLSFYDQNDVEVAYISDYKIHITHAEVSGTLKVGGYLIETNNGLAFKWVGRS